MFTMLKDWKGEVEINGEKYQNITEAISNNNTLQGQVHIKLYSPVHERRSEDGNEDISKDKVYRITVKPYMTKKSEPGFDFMLKWNNDNPMPMVTMTGTVVQETRGMVRMKLKGVGEATCNCLRCGRQLDNPISKYYGIGPECMQKLGLIRDVNDVEGIKQDLQEIEWEGWIIKSAIKRQEEVTE